MIITAVDNENIRGLLEENYSNINKNDITYMEGVIEYLSKNSNNITEEDILITKDSLEGNLNKYTYITQLRVACTKIKIIIFVENLDNIYKDFLFANNIFNIIEGEYIKEDELLAHFKTDEKIIYKYIDKNIDIDSNNSEYLKEEILDKNDKNDKNDKKNKKDTNPPNISYISNIFNPKNKTNNILDNNSNDDNNSNISTSKIISIFGTSGSGKSVISNVIADEISKKISNVEVIFCDFDIQNPTTDILRKSNLSSNSNCIYDIITDINNNSYGNISYYLTNVKSTKNLKILTNNLSLTDVYNNISIRHYKKIYKDMRNTSNSIYINDLPNNLNVDTVEFFTTNSDLLVFVINPNYVSIRQGIKYLEHITKVWKIKKEKITIIVNNFKEGSLEFSVIETIFNEYNVCYGLSYIKDFENYLNGNKKYVGFKINIKPILNYININGKENAKEGM